MTAQEFNVLLERRIQKIRDVLQAKASEYATDDRLHNFKSQPLDNLSETPEQVLWGYLRKHLQSVYDLVMGLKTTTSESVNEKVGDSINYLILLEALFNERIEGKHIKRTFSPNQSSLPVFEGTDGID